MRFGTGTLTPKPDSLDVSELLIPAGYVQIGRPDTGDFDAICFDLNHQAQDQAACEVLTELAIEAEADP